MPRKRKRRRLNWGPILIVLLLGNITAGVFFSKLTSVVRVQVRGVPSWDRPRVEAILLAAKDTPAMVLNPHRVESEVQALPEAEVARLSRNVFGRANLAVQYREPVARVQAKRLVGLTYEGVLYPAHSLPPGLPIVRPPKESALPLIGFVGSWNPGEVAQVCDQTRDLALNRTVIVSVDSQGGVCLNIGSGGAVQLGQPTELEAKLSLVRRKLQEDPSFLERLEYLDVKAPDRPQQKLKDQARLQ
jgi:cell division septal protein FtsQ